MHSNSQKLDKNIVSDGQSERGFPRDSGSTYIGDKMADPSSYILLRPYQSNTLFEGLASLNRFHLGRD